MLRTLIGACLLLALGSCASTEEAQTMEAKTMPAEAAAVVVDEEPRPPESPRSATT